MFTEEHLGKFGFGEDERPEKATKHRRQLGGKTSPPSMYARSHENDTKISPRALWTLSIIPLPQQRRVYGHMLLALQGTFPY